MSKIDIAIAALESHDSRKDGGVPDAYFITECFRASLPELRALLAERDALRELVVHMWIHDGYPRNGYSDMTTEQKALYEKTIEDGVS